MGNPDDEVVVMRRPCLPEDEGRHFFVKQCTRAEAESWIAQRADEFFKPSDYYIASVEIAQLRQGGIFDGFEHLSRDEHEDKLHFSHLFQYVSAYEASEERLEDLRTAIVDGLREAQSTHRPVIVDQDGEMFILCHGGGTISLCLRWKTYKLLEPDGVPGDPVVEEKPNPPSFPRDVGPRAVFAPPPLPYAPCNNYEMRGIDAVYCGLPRNHEGSCEFTRAV